MKNFYMTKKGPFVDSRSGEPYVLEHDSKQGWRFITLKGKAYNWERASGLREMFEKKVKDGDYIPYKGKVKEEKKEGIDLDELQKENEKLMKLLSDRQLGLITWNSLLKETLENVVKLAAQAGILAK